MAGRDARGGRGLLYHSGGLGDFVLSLPAIFRVVQAHPGVEWALWGPRDRLCLLPGFRTPPIELLQEGHTLWNAPSPAAVEALQRFRVLLVFGAGEGPPWGKWASGRVLPVISFPASGGVHVSVFQRRQLDALGVPAIRHPWLPRWRAALTTREAPGPIAIHPGSGSTRKNVPPGVWATVAQRLRAETGLPVRAVLGPVEEDRGGLDPLLSCVDEVTRCVRLAELATLLSGSRLFLGNDSGVAHLAGVLGLAAVVAFGPTDPRVWRPLGPRVLTVTPGRECAPCTTRGPITCDAPECLREVSTSRLVRAARRALALRPGAGRDSSRGGGACRLGVEPV